MAKNKKYNDANWMAILQMLSGTPQGQAAAVATSMLVDSQKDGLQQKDIHNNAANTVYAEKNDVLSFIQNMFQNNPEMMDELDKYLDENSIELQSLNDLIPAIKSMLQVKGYGEGGQFDEMSEFVDVEIAGKQYHLLNLLTEEQKEKGLMDVESMESNEGALFDYSDNPQESIDFWMKNTSIPLDIIFINEDGVVISVKQGVPESEELISESSEFVAYVIELNASSGVKPGDDTSLGKGLDLSGLEPGKLYMLNENGEVQAVLAGGERIFSRNNTKSILRITSRYLKTGNQNELKRLGKKIFEYMEIQDNREPEYVEQ